MQEVQLRGVVCGGRHHTRTLTTEQHNQLHDNTYITTDDRRWPVGVCRVLRVMCRVSCVVCCVLCVVRSFGRCLPLCLGVPF